MFILLQTRLGFGTISQLKSNSRLGCLFISLIQSYEGIFLNCSLFCHLISFTVKELWWVLNSPQPTVLSAIHGLEVQIYGKQLHHHKDSLSFPQTFTNSSPDGRTPLYLLNHPKKLNGQWLIFTRVLFCHEGGVALNKKKRAKNPMFSFQVVIFWIAATPGEA